MSLRIVVEDLVTGFMEERNKQNLERDVVGGKLKEEVAGDRFGGMVR
jgi:hypothetical protein